MSLLTRIGFNKGNKPAERVPAEARQADVGGARPSRFRPMMGLVNRPKPDTEAAAPQAKALAPRRQAAGELKTRMDAQKHRRQVAAQTELASTHAVQEADIDQMQAKLNATSVAQKTEMAQVQAELDARMANTNKVAERLRNMNLGGAKDIDQSSLVTDDLSIDNIDAEIEAEIAAAGIEMEGSAVTEEISMDDLDAEIASAEAEAEAEMQTSGKALSDRVDKMQIDNQRRAQAEADSEAAQAQATAESAGKALSDRVDKMQIDNQRRAQAEADSEAAQAAADSRQTNADIEALQAQVDAEPVMSQAELEQSFKEIDAEIAAQNPSITAKPNQLLNSAAKLAAENAEIEARFQLLMGGQAAGPSVAANKPQQQAAPQQQARSNSPAQLDQQATPRAHPQATNQAAQAQSRSTLAAQARQTSAAPMTNAATGTAKPSLRPAQQQALNQLQQNQALIQKKLNDNRDNGFARKAVFNAGRMTRGIIQREPNLTTDQKKQVYAGAVQRMLAKEMLDNNPRFAGKTPNDSIQIRGLDVNVGRYIGALVKQYVEKNPALLDPPASLGIR